MPSLSSGHDEMVPTRQEMDGYDRPEGAVLADLLRQTAQARGAPVDHLSPGYLRNLTSLPLEELTQQPSLIASETSTVETELINLCFREYPTFVSVHKCSAAVQAAFDDFDTSLGALLGSVPLLEEECRVFAQRTNATQASRSKAAVVQENQDKLLDILEIPRLMETSVRNGYYQEAMELAAHAKDLSERLGGVPLIEDMYAEVESVAQVMLAQLVSSLREPVKLPLLIKAIGYLRRLGSMEEDELGVIFLISRLHNFQASVQHIERERHDPVRYIRRYIDLFREHIYDIVSQYSSIFADTSLLHSFAQRCVDDLVQVIESHVPRMAGDSASLSCILVQLGYCSASFSRVGLDFAALVIDPFLETVTSAYSEQVDKATAGLLETLRIAAAAEDPSSLSNYDFANVSANTVPALEVTSFPPLARYANECLSSLNTLRLLAPVAIRDRLATILRESFANVSDVLLMYAAQAMDAHAQPGKSHPTTAKHWRRSSESLLTPEVRQAKLKQRKLLLSSLTHAFRHSVIPMVLQAQEEGVYTGHADLLASAAVQRLDLWLREASDMAPTDLTPSRSAHEPESLTGQPALRMAVHDGRPVTEQEQVAKSDSAAKAAPSADAQRDDVSIRDVDGVMQPDTSRGDIAQPDDESAHLASTTARTESKDIDAYARAEASDQATHSSVAAASPAVDNLQTLEPTQSPPAAQTALDPSGALDLPETAAGGGELLHAQHAERVTALDSSSASEPEGGSQHIPTDQAIQEAEVPATIPALHGAAEPPHVPNPPKIEEDNREAGVVPSGDLNSQNADETDEPATVTSADEPGPSGTVTPVESEGVQLSENGAQAGPGNKAKNKKKKKGKK